MIVTTAPNHTEVPYNTAVERTEMYVIDEVMLQCVINPILSAFRFYTYVARPNVALSEEHLH